MLQSLDIVTISGLAIKLKSTTCEMSQKLDGRLVNLVTVHAPLGADSLVASFPPLTGPERHVSCDCMESPEWKKVSQC